MDKKNRGLLYALVGVFLIFALLVPVYWAVSSSSPDGLDKLLEEHSVPEKAPVNSPPITGLLGYGTAIPVYILSGIIGAIAVLAILFLVGKALVR
jgi:hypothetical protein